MLNKAPMLLVLLLGAVVAARIGIAFVVDSPLSTALAWAGLLGVLSAAALLGRRLAGDALAWLCLILGADTLIQLLFVEVPAWHAAAAIGWASLVMGTGTYLLRSEKVRRFQAPSERENR